MKAALLMAHGFNDWNVVPEHSVRIYEAPRLKVYLFSSIAIKAATAVIHPST